MRLFYRFDTVVKVFADDGYTGTLIDWAKVMFGYDVEFVKRNEMHTFKVLPKRWIVERNFAWMGYSRRLSRDYELYPTSAEAMTWISSSHTMLRRIT
jgi:putative transposase